MSRNYEPSWDPLDIYAMRLEADALQVLSLGVGEYSLHEFGELPRMWFEYLAGCDRSSYRFVETPLA